MSEEINVLLRLDKKGNGEFYLERDNEKLGVMEIEIIEDKLIVYHTEVSEKLAGMHMGQKLLDHMVNYVRENKLMVIVQCPFVLSQFRKHREKYDDIWYKSHDR